MTTTSTIRMVVSSVLEARLGARVLPDLVRRSRSTSLISATSVGMRARRRIGKPGKLPIRSSQPREMK